MKASEALTRPLSMNVHVAPSLVSLTRSVDRITAQWPDVVAQPEERDRETLAMEMLLRVSKWSWENVKLSRILSAALAIFDEERRARTDLESVRNFFVSEIRQTSSSTFLAGMVQVYLETFDANARHTQALAMALEAKASSLQGRLRNLHQTLPDLFVPQEAPAALANVMLKSEAPYSTLKNLGFRAPHGAGLTRAAHHKFTRQLAPDLRQDTARRRLFAWLFPTKGTTLQTDAGIAVEALLRAWGDTPPPDQIREEITEAVISAYNDPRTHSGGIWPGFDSGLKAIFLRWLTKQDMLFFCDMVTATQDSHMWAPRRDFWLGLYDDGRIDEAWVAFGSAARDYARHNLMRQGATDINRRFGRQNDRGGSTSLLIMRIGRKIVVDGCHSYKTHIFRSDDAAAPKLYGRVYYCDQIMRRSRNSKSHSSIPSWQDWVMRNV
jgi:hypothetical protein